MPEENQDVTQVSSPVLAEAIASSPEVKEEVEQQISDTQTPTAEEGVNQEQVELQEEEPRIPYSRFKEKVDETNWYKQQLELQLQRQQSQQPIQQPTTESYTGMTAEEERFWRAVDARAEKIAEQKIQKVNPMLNAGIRELTILKVQQFRTAHPDIKPNSPEENQIAQKIGQGYLPEDAYRAVMWDRKVADSEKQANQQVKQKTEAKKQANVEQRSIPSNASLPTNQKLTLRQRIEQNLSKIEKGEI